MKVFFSFLLCVVFLMFASVEQGYTAQGKSEQGINIGVPAAIDITINTSSLTQAPTICYESIYCQPFDHGLSVAVLNAHKELNFNVLPIIDKSNVFRIDINRQSCTIERSNDKALNSLPFDHGLNKLA